MATSTALEFLITAKDEASATLNSVSDSLKANRDGLLAVGAAAGIAFAGITDFAKQTIDAANEGQAAQAQLKAVLESTHGAAGLYIEDLNDQAEALQDVTTYTNEQVNSVQALLLTFTSIGGPVVQQATGTILDMSTALHEDLQSASIQVGKALQDPINGITALKRVGVDFSDSQKAVIQSLVDTGKTAQAQQLILAELNKEFGGSAESAANTFGGEMTQLSNTFNDLQKAIGNAIIPVLQSLYLYIRPLIEAFDQWAQANPDLIAKILGFAAAITGTITVVAGLGLVLPAIISGFELMFGPIGLVIIAVTAAVAIFITFHTQITAFFENLDSNTGIITFFKEAWQGIVDVFQQDLLPQLQKLWVALQPLMPFLQALAQVIGFTIVAAIYIFIGVITGTIVLLTEFLTWITNIATFLATVFSDALTLVTGYLSDLMLIWPKISTAIQTFVTNAIAFFQPFINMIDSVVTKVQAVGSAISSVGAGVGSAVSSAVHAIVPKAGGGTINSNGTYMVGENGPELFTSSVGGQIIPNGQLAGAGGSNININISGAVMTRDAANALGSQIMQQLRFKTRLGI